jgi:stage II sporulation protein GA (sporulation sigma-E factor processing peptidase)
MKIALEYVLIENFLINLIVLKTVELAFKENGRLFWLSALLGAIFSLGIFFVQLSPLGQVLLQLSFAVFYLCISFKFSTLKKFFSLYFCYFLVAFLYGGACYFVESLFGISSLLVVLIVVSVVFVAVMILLKIRRRKRNVENFCFDIKIDVCGRTYSFKAFLDSGNFLFDPLTEKPVCLINFKAFSTLFDWVKPEDVILKTERLKKIKFAHFIKLNTLASSDKILVFQVDSITVGDKTFDKPTLGLSTKNFSQAFGSDVILHNEFAFEG